MSEKRGRTLLKKGAVASEDRRRGFYVYKFELYLLVQGHGQVPW